MVLSIFSWETNRTIAEYELRLSRMAAIPIVGTIFGVVKVAGGCLQAIAGLFGYVYGQALRVFDGIHDIGKINFSAVHMEHGLYNILAGVLEAIPLVGSLLYFIRWNRQPSGTEYQILTGHEMHFAPYRHLELSDAQIGQPSSIGRLQLSKAIAWGLVQAPSGKNLQELLSSTDSSIPLKALFLTESWNNLNAAEQEWLTDWFVFSYVPATYNEAGVLAYEFRGDVNWEVLLDDQAKVPSWRIIEILRSLENVSPVYLFNRKEENKKLKDFVDIVFEKGDARSLESIYNWLYLLVSNTNTSFVDRRKRLEILLEAIANKLKLVKQRINTGEAATSSTGNDSFGSQSDPAFNAHQPQPPNGQNQEATAASTPSSAGATSGLDGVD